MLKQADDIPKVIPKVSDLHISGQISIQPNPGKIHKLVTFLITIKNSSNVRMAHSPACYLKMVFSYQGNYPYYGDYKSDPYYYVIPEIGSMGKCTLEVKFRFHKKNVWRVWVKADGKNTVKEFFEDNNTRFKYF